TSCLLSVRFWPTSRTFATHSAIAVPLTRAIGAPRPTRARTLGDMQPLSGGYPAAPQAHASPNPGRHATSPGGLPPPPRDVKSAELVWHARLRFPFFTRRSTRQNERPETGRGEPVHTINWRGPRSAAPSDPRTLGRAFFLAGGGSPRLRRIIRDLARLLCPRGKRRDPRVRGMLGGYEENPSVGRRLAAAGGAGGAGAGRDHL